MSTTLFAALRRPVALAALAGAAAIGLGGCETESYGPARYATYESGAPARVQEAVVVASRPITIGGPDRPDGAGVGAVAGGVLGATLGGDWRGPSLAGGLVGAAVGALAGHAVSKGDEHPGVLYTVRMRRDGSLLQVAQPDPYPLRNGTPVFVSFGARVRIEPAGGYAPPARPTPQSQRD